MTTIVDWTNQFRALVSESKSDSKDSETASVTLARHSDYIREVKADQRRLLSAAQRLEDEEDWENDTDTDSNSNMKVTVEALEGLCTEMISPLYEYDTVVLQNWKRILVNILS